ncbi:MAG: hypothetical protein U0T02_00815 [Solirubrobacteraceae bacterium]
MSVASLERRPVRPAGPAPAPIAPPRARRWRAAALPAAGTAIAVVLWAFSIGAMDPRRMDATGLVSIMPAGVLIALALLTASFAVTVTRRDLVVPLLAVQLGALIVMLFGVTALVESQPRFEAAWRHAGIIEFITSTGTVDPGIDAYFSWPGFFILGGLLVKAAGYQSAISLLAWAPVFFNLLYIGPIVMIVRAATPDRRVLWLTLWIVSVANWMGQDYFSPQAAGYFLFLVIVAILLRWFVAEPAVSLRPSALLSSARLPWWGPERDPAGGLRDGPALRMALMGIVIVCFAAVVPSHQLTPFAALAAATVLVLFGGCTARGLPILMAVLIGIWIAYMTTVFLKGHLSTLTGSVGKVDTAVSANLSNRIAGDPGHLIVVYSRLALTGGLFALAGLGWLRRMRRGLPVRAHAVLALAPFPLLVLQPYGGEMLVRVALFSLPFSAFFAASALAPDGWRLPSWRAPALVGVVCAGLLALFLFARYGNEKMDFFSDQEVAAVHELYRVAPRGSLLLTASQPLPWKFQDYGSYKFRILSQEVQHAAAEGKLTPGLVGETRAVMSAFPRGRSFLIVTRSQLAHDELLGATQLLPIARLERALLGSRLFRVVYRNRDAVILRLAGGGSSG